jgi:hypothetical protein
MKPSERGRKDTGEFSLRFACFENEIEHGAGFVFQAIIIKFLHEKSGSL